MLPRMPRRLIFGAVMLLAATAGLQWAGAAGQLPEPRTEAAPGALATPGVARSWGSDFSGKLGDDFAFADQDEPVPVSGLSNVVQLAAGDNHSLALLDDGTVMAWGSDASGQLGNGPTVTANQALPGVVGGLSGVTAIAAGHSHSLALLNDGTVMAWGGDADGQLGNGPTLTANQPSPVAVDGLSDVEQIAAGALHSLALLSDGTVMAWGRDSEGQLGNGDTTTGNQDEPVVVSGLSAVQAVAAGTVHSLALRSDGTIRAWGSDGDGQLGNGDTTTGNQDEPVVVSGLSGVTAIAAGFNHSLALRSNGTLRAWGDNGNGQLGKGTTGGDEDGPVVVTGLSAATAIGAGNLYSLALLSDGTVQSWGFGANGRLGNGATDGRDEPGPVSGLPGVAAIAAGTSHALAVVVTCLGQPVTILGTDSGETINGTAGLDVIDGGGGNDVINGRGGNDIICGGDGNDTIDGGGGQERVDGGAGVDTVKFPGNVGRNINLLTGTASGEGSGRRLTAIENVKGSNGNDVIKGNNKANRLEGNKGNDTLRGGKGNDKLFGGGGTDTCDGGGGADTADGNCETKKNIP